MSYKIDTVSAERGPVKAALGDLPEIADGKEISHFDLGFLCELIRLNRPAKVVEVGTAAGGSCAVMLHCLHDLGIDAEVHAIDILTYAHLDPGKAAGHLAVEEADRLGCARPTMHLGVTLPQVIDAIGGGIDLLVLDTTHVMPGEVLDFLVALPYLSDGAIVCMHDIRQQYRNVKNVRSFATTLLMSCVVGEKFISTDDKRTHGYPNIGAFRVTAQKREHVGNVAQALTVPWSDVLDDEQLALYRRAIEVHGDEVLWFFDHAVLLNKDSERERILSGVVRPKRKLPGFAKRALAYVRAFRRRRG